VKSVARVTSISKPNDSGVRFATLEIDHSLYDVNERCGPVSLPSERMRANRWPIGLAGSHFGGSCVLPEDVQVGDEVEVRYIYAGYWGVVRVWYTGRAR